MTQVEKRKIKIRVSPRDTRDSRELLTKIKITFNSEQINFEIQKFNISENSEVEKSYLDIELEQELLDEARRMLDERTVMSKGSDTNKNPKNKQQTKKDVFMKRQKIRTWLKQIIKEGYRITVKSFFDAILDKSKPM